MPFHIQIGTLHGSAHRDRSLGSLTLRDHIHGELSIVIHGRTVPAMGYFGPDDVCFAAWLVELRNASEALRALGAVYIYDEGEQGQPAFRFERVGDEVAFSIVESELSGAGGIATWQNERFSYAAFSHAVEQTLVEFRRRVREGNPRHGPAWLARAGF